MPTLNWIGKDAVINHHLEVPFHLLKDVLELGCGDPACFANPRFRCIDQRGAYQEEDPTAPGGRKFELKDPRNGNSIHLRHNRGWAFDQQTPYAILTR